MIKKLLHEEKNMKLVQRVKADNSILREWSIYELNDEEHEKFGNKFALSQGVFSATAIEESGADELLSKLTKVCYEGFFETQKEAYMQVMLAETKYKLDKIKRMMKEVLEMPTPKWE